MTCATTSSVTLKPHTSGDTWRGLSIALKRNGVPIDLTGARIDMHMRVSAASTAIVQSWSTTDNTIEISVPTEGLISVLKRRITATSNLVFDVQVTYADQDVKTVLTGTLPISIDVTRVP